MFRRLLPGILVVCSLLIDVTVLPLFTSSRYIPAFSLITVLCLGLLMALFHRLNMTGSCSDGYISLSFVRQVRQEFGCRLSDQVL